MIFKIIAILLLSTLVGCKGGAGSPELNLPPEGPTPVDNNASSESLYSVKEYILPSMQIHSTNHGGFDINVAEDDSIVVAGLIKVFDPNLGSYPQKIMLWNISDDISFNEIESGTNIFKTNYSDIAGVDHNYVRIVFDGGGLPMVGYINYSGKLKIVSTAGILANTNIDCDHISSAFDEALMNYSYSCLKNITSSNTDLKLNIVSSEGNLVLTKTYTDKASMNSAHAYESKDGVPYVFVKNYANLNQEKNFSLLSENGLQVIARGQSDWGNLEVLSNNESDTICATISGTTIKQYNATHVEVNPIIGINSTVNKTLANCLSISTSETLFYSESSLSDDKGYIFNENGEKILNLNSYRFKKIYVAKYIVDSLYIVGIEKESNQVKVLKIKRL